MNITQTGIEGLVVLEPKRHGDERGWFSESFSKRKLEKAGIAADFVQDNHAFSKAGSLRGLHYQAPPHAQVKLVRCSMGRLYDVAVDVRSGSETYGKWFGVELSAENGKQLYIPKGFLHGYIALTDCEMQYKVSDYYAPETDGGVRYDDPDIAIEWPKVESEIIQSEKDTQHPFLKDAHLPF
jgi:dTDP-4-dehydrorhamnose 3,5-epimerase